jgi:hypothetical protein
VSSRPLDALTRDVSETAAALHAELVPDTLELRIAGATDAELLELDRELAGLVSVVDELRRRARAGLTTAGEVAS